MADFEEMRNAVQRATQDDIAHRLRVGADRFLNIARMHEVLLQAADEIERLRAELKQVRDVH